MDDFAWSYEHQAIEESLVDDGLRNYNIIFF